MSPVPPPPPPAGTFIPSDDWSDDPSFDLSSSPLGGHAIASNSGALASSSHSASSSSSSRSSIGSLAGLRGMTGSPLRQMHSSQPGKARGGFGAEDDDVDFDFEEDVPLSLALAKIKLGKPTPTPTAGGTLKRASGPSKMGTIGLTGTVIGMGPSGVGTITRLGMGSGKSGAGSAVPAGTVKARLAAFEPKSAGPRPTSKQGQGWERDLADLDHLDFGDEGDNGDTLRRGAQLGGTRGRFVLPPSGAKVAAADALDDLDFDFDGEGAGGAGEDEDQATLKAGATIKALLPPPRPTAHTKGTAARSPPAEEDLETDLILPLNLTNLTLATQSHSRPSTSGASKQLKPRASTSTMNSDWDSPSSGGASGSGKKTGVRARAIWDDSPWSKRPSETSGTSISEDIDLGTPVRKGRAVEVEVEGEEEGEEMMQGLILPSRGFFEGKREGELNRILDVKRKAMPGQAGVASGQKGNGAAAGMAFGIGGWHKRTGTGGSRADESMEEGLVFDDQVKELTGHRLRQQRKARSQTQTQAAVGHGGSKRREAGAATAGTGVAGNKGSWERNRELGWGRHTPLPVLTKDRERERETPRSSVLGLPAPAVGHRSHSASSPSPYSIPAPSSRDFSSASTTAAIPSSRRYDPLPQLQAQVEPPRQRTQSTMGPPPIPSTPSSRLRHQKSHYHMPPVSPSPTLTLTRKQSLSSLQDALSHAPTPAPAQSITTGSAEQGLPVRNVETPQKDRYHASTSRLTMATSSSRAKTRPPISNVFPRSEIIQPTAPMVQHYTPTSTSMQSISGLSRAPARSQPQVQVQSQMIFPLGGRRRPATAVDGKKRTWGDGTELEGIEDLEIDEGSARATPVSQAANGGLGLGRPAPGRKGDSLGRSSGLAKIAESDKRKKSGSGDKTGSVSRRKTKKAAGLIKHLGTVDKRKVVGDMTWNPATLRWEGNESILRDFDPVTSPTSASGAGAGAAGTVRPALITHYTGGLHTSTGSSTPAHTHAHTASTIRIVGDMKFDPERMCWVSLGNEEPDPFADMADDEDDEGGFGSNTLTRANAKKLVSVGVGASGALGASSAGSEWSSRLASESSAGGSVISWEERTRFRQQPDPASDSLTSAELWRECREAEERHKKEVKGWSGLGIRPGMSREEVKERERREEKRLWEIRYLAMRS